MKKIYSLVLAGVMALSVIACGGPKDEPVSNVSADNTVSATTSVTTQAAGNPVENVFFPATSSATGAYATIKISADVKMDDESAWLGLCPTGKDYITELEADDVDVVWFNADYREETDPYIFACDFSSVDDGTYALVVATSDDENVGYIVIQLEMTKSGETLTFDFANAKIKERPKK